MPFKSLNAGQRRADEAVQELEHALLPEGDHAADRHPSELDCRNGLLRTGDHRVLPDMSSSPDGMARAFAFEIARPSPSVQGT